MDLIPEQEIAQHLASGERLLWAGRPGQGIRLRGSDALYIPFSLMWGGFAIFWEFMVIRTGAPFLFRLWGVPFVLIGLYLIGGRFFWDAYRRRATVYGLTDSRVLIVEEGFQRSTRAVRLETLGDVTVNERRDGSGDILLGAAPFGVQAVNRGWPGSRPQVPTLEFLPRVREVFDMIRHAQGRAV
jgi:hypothetical protein